MKIGIVGDIHWSRYSSIVRSRGEKYSYRLDNCINSINWAEQITSFCDRVVYLGDFFDSSELNSEEITALNDIVWNTVPHHFLVGNHEMGINNLSHSSSHIFGYMNMQSSVVEDIPIEVLYDDTILTFLPYILEDNRKPLKEYLSDTKCKRIIFSHNDIAGIQLGKFTSKNGFSIEEIESNCDRFINGHIHNGGKITDKIINIGNLTGQNFSEDAYNYDHVIFILDTDTLRISVYENPYAMNFYKLDTAISSIDWSKLKSNAVVTVKCTFDEQESIKNELNNNNNVVAHRLILNMEKLDSITTNSKEILAVNHLDKFQEYILQTLGNADEVKEELEEVLK